MNPAARKPLPKMQTAIALIGLIAGVFLSWAIMEHIKMPVKNKAETAARPFPSAATPSALPAVAAEIEPAASQTPAPAQQIPKLALNGILLSKEGNLALINGRIAKAGEAIEGAKIKEISSEYVTLDFNGQDILLKNK